MERSDGRLLPVAALNERRRRAVVLYLNGMTLDEISVLCELSRNTVIDAARAYRKGGWEAVPVQAHRGPNKGDGCLLDAAQQAVIQTLIHDHTPEELTKRIETYEILNANLMMSVEAHHLPRLLHARMIKRVVYRTG